MGPNSFRPLPHHVQQPGFSIGIVNPKYSSSLNPMYVMTTSWGLAALDSDSDGNHDVLPRQPQVCLQQRLALNNDATVARCHSCGGPC